MLEFFKEERKKSLKEIWEHTIKQVKEINKSVQDLKTEVEETKKTQIERILRIKNPGKRTRKTDTITTNKIKNDRRETLRHRRYKRKKLIHQSKKC